jgi:hypothetical protein
VTTRLARDPLHRGYRVPGEISSHAVWLYSRFSPGPRDVEELLAERGVAVSYESVRRCGLRRSRYVGEVRTHLGHVLTATALTFVRVAEWLAGTPRGRTRRSEFALLMSPA